MEKLLKSKLFIILTPIIVFIVGIGAGYLLGYQPHHRIVGTYTYIEYHFRIETAIGYWLLALILSIITLLLCVIIRNHYLAKSKAANTNVAE